MSKISKPKSQPLLQRLWLNSETKLLAYSQAVSGIVLYGATSLHSAISDSSIKDALGQLALPKWFPIVLLILASLTYVAHGHKED